MTKNILVIDNAVNCVYDIFAVDDETFTIIFPNDQDIEFVEDLVLRIGDSEAGKLLQPVWKNRVRKVEVSGIHGTLFFDCLHKKQYYPTKRDEEATNPR